MYIHIMAPLTWTDLAYYNKLWCRLISSRPVNSVEVFTLWLLSGFKDFFLRRIADRNENGVRYSDWVHWLGDRKAIRPVNVLPQQFPQVYFWGPAWPGVTWKNNSGKSEPVRQKLTVCICICLVWWNIKWRVMYQ